MLFVVRRKSVYFFGCCRLSRHFVEKNSFSQWITLTFYSIMGHMAWCYHFMHECCVCTFTRFCYASSYVPYIRLSVDILVFLYVLIQTLHIFHFILYKYHVVMHILNRTCITFLLYY